VVSFFLLWWIFFLDTLVLVLLLFFTTGHRWLGGEKVKHDLLKYTYVIPEVQGEAQIPDLLWDVLMDLLKRKDVVAVTVGIESDSARYSCIGR
jgi:hypothetical protein